MAKGTFGGSTFGGKTFQDGTIAGDIVPLLLGFSPTQTPSPIIGAGAVATQAQLWEPLVAFRHNWEDGFSMASRWPVLEEWSRMDAGQRIGLTSKPVRRFTASFMAKKDVAANILGQLQATPQVGHLRNQLSRYARARGLVPLYPDLVVSTASTGGNLGFEGNFADRRFYPDGRAIYSSLPNPKQWVGRTGPHFAATFEHRIIAAVTATDITFDAPTVQTGAGLRIWPAMEVDVVLDLASIAYTDEHVVFTGDFFETAGTTALDPTVYNGENPPGIPTYDGLPILSALQLQWAEDIMVGISARGDLVPAGTGNALELYGGPRQIFELPYQQLTRAAAMSLIRFWDSRRGPLLPFWMLSPTHDLLLNAQDTDLVEVQTIGYADVDWSTVTHIGAQDAGGAWRIAEIDSIVDNASSPPSSTINLVAGQWATPLTTPLRKFSTAHKCQFREQEMIQLWSTPEAMGTRMSCAALLDEASHGPTLIDTCPDGEPGEPDEPPPPCPAELICGCNDNDAPDYECIVCLETSPLIRRQCRCGPTAGGACEIFTIAVWEWQGWDEAECLPTAGTAESIAQWRKNFSEIPLSEVQATLDLATGNWPTWGGVIDLWDPLEPGDFQPCIEESQACPAENPFCSCSGTCQGMDNPTSSSCAYRAEYVCIQACAGDPGHEEGYYLETEIIYNGVLGTYPEVCSGAAAVGGGGIGTGAET